MKNPIVSVTVSSYKHAKYLPACLDSILNQKTNFEYEVIVGEDCSNDGSREILLDYLDRYPNKLTVIFNEENLGVTKNGFNIRKRCKGKYITGCESDDYWCDEYKLQKQVDYLESHPDIAAVGANYYYIDNDDTWRRLALRYNQTDRTYHLKDFLYYGFIAHGNTLMRRCETTPAEGEEYEKLRFSAPTQGDVITRCLIYDKGGIYVFPEPMLCHRDGSSLPSSFTAQNKNKAIFYTHMHRDILLALNKYFDGKYDFTPKLCHRLGYILIDKLRGSIKFDMREFNSIFNSLKFSHKILTIWQFIRQILEKIYNIIYWKFHDCNQYKVKRKENGNEQ